ncbi:MAG: class I SAM-dependent methyltransferase [Candidatus Korobacteraceae bacterium]
MTDPLPDLRSKAATTGGKAAGGPSDCAPVDRGSNQFGAAVSALSHQGDVPVDPYKESFYPEIRFGGFSDSDGTVTFYNRVNAMTTPDSVVVDFGCGRGRHADDPVAFRRGLQCLKGRVARVIGLDVDLAGQQNPTLDEFRALRPEEAWPIEDGSVNLVLCDCVLEHLPKPSLFFSEAHRVLVRGGFLCLRTTNLLGYVGLAAKLIPKRLHTSVLHKAQGMREEKDIFPTLYRCNTIRSIRREMKAHGFHAVVYGHNAEPSYFNFSRLAYAAGVLHQKMAPGAFGITIFAFGEVLS